MHAEVIWVLFVKSIFVNVIPQHKSGMEQLVLTISLIIQGHVQVIANVTMF
jgi:hypothetical protein